MSVFSILLQCFLSVCVCVPFPPLAHSGQWCEAIRQQFCVQSWVFTKQEKISLYNFFWHIFFSSQWWPCLLCETLNNPFHVSTRSMSLVSLFLPPIRSQSWGPHGGESGLTWSDWECFSSRWGNKTEWISALWFQCNTNPRASARVRGDLTGGRRKRSLSLLLAVKDGRGGHFVVRPGISSMIHPPPLPVCPSPPCVSQFCREGDAGTLKESVSFLRISVDQNTKGLIRLSPSSSI